MEDAKSDSDAESEPESCPSINSQPTAPPHPLNALRTEVVNIIDKLFYLSNLIRGTSPNFHGTKASAHVEKDEEGNDIRGEGK